jgi:hypothetical protein
MTERRKRVGIVLAEMAATFMFVSSLTVHLARGASVFPCSNGRDLALNRSPEVTFRAGRDCGSQHEDPST